MADVQKLAIIGASDFQNPLILAAKARGIETHVFAWEDDAVGEKTADFFYPISIVDIDRITEKCRELQVDGVVSIGSDLANITVAAVADTLGLTANSLECVGTSTDKAKMRSCFWENGDPSPKYLEVAEGNEGVDFSELDLAFPIIVKPADRSGSRGITKVHEADELSEAVARAAAESFNGNVLVEEFARGREFSVEYISWEGKHSFLAITEKFTNGSPHYIETGHLQPARISDDLAAAVCEVVEHALDSLGVEYGASHSEVKVDDAGNIKIIEIGSRMGGDCIGSHLVQLSTGYDFVGAVIDVALGVEPPRLGPSQPTRAGRCERAAAVRFVFEPEDVRAIEALEQDGRVEVALKSELDEGISAITDSASRHGFCVFSAASLADVEPYLPSNNLC